MMKRINLIYALLLAFVLSTMTACYNDDPISEGSEKDGKVTVRIRISQAGAAVTRATDKYAQDEELMNVWTVVVTDNSGNVKHILACKPKKEDREIDPIETELYLSSGEHHFYSFANISPKYVQYLLGITQEVPTSDDTFPTGYQEGTIISIDDVSGTITLDKAKAKTIGINGNDFKIDAIDNGFLSSGIPMSNVQTINVTEPVQGQTQEIIDLVVVRMLAKIKLEITNNGADDVTITSIKLTDITQNVTDKPNLYLFPLYKKDASPSNSSDLMTGYEHGHIQPNLTADVTTDEFEKTGKWTIARGSTETISFYVNESATPKNKNEFNRFYLKLNLSKQGTAVTEERYALIDDNGTQNNEKWDYIARNDYRIIPINLIDYKVELVPYDFPAIGVYPASVKEEDGLNTITFHDYGHFHLLPKVTKFTTSGIESVNFSSTKGWSLVNNIFSASWKSWENYENSIGQESTTNNPGNFYAETDNVAKPDGSANINDGDDAGGVPVWYDNGATTASEWNRPQWSPVGITSSTTYQPFIFGYIANPGKALDQDRKVYHEFTIQINEGSSSAKELTYRLYMIIDKEQMLYRSRALDAPAARHTHHGPHI